jgi:hypothetical protein
MQRKRTTVDLERRGVKKPAIEQSIKPSLVKRVSSSVDWHVSSCSGYVATLDERDRVIGDSGKPWMETESHPSRKPVGIQVITNFSYMRHCANYHESVFISHISRVQSLIYYTKASRPDISVA